MIFFQGIVVIYERHDQVIQLFSYISDNYRLPLCNTFLKRHNSRLIIPTIAIQSILMWLAGNTHQKLNVNLIYRHKFFGRASGLWSIDQWVESFIGPLVLSGRIFDRNSYWCYIRITNLKTQPKKTYQCQLRFSHDNVSFLIDYWVKEQLIKLFDIYQWNKARELFQDFSWACLNKKRALRLKIR